MAKTHSRRRINLKRENYDLGPAHLAHKGFLCFRVVKSSHNFLIFKISQIFLHESFIHLEFIVAYGER